MKKRLLWIVGVLLLLGVFLTGCSTSSRNLQEELPNKWEVCHWYYNIDNGDNGFFDESMYYDFNDGKLVITSKDGTITKEGTYQFTGKDTLDIGYKDGTVASFQLIASNHDGVDQIQFMDVNTKYTLTLEPLEASSN